jgi:hypothetical protein
MNKRGLLDFNAGIVVLVLVVYFIFFSFIVYAVGSAFPNSDIDDSSQNLYSQLISKSGLEQLSYCDKPRYEYDISKSERFESGESFDNYLSCDKSAGAISTSVCNNIAGCNWAVENISYSFWDKVKCYSFWDCPEDGSTYAYCNGTMDVSAFNMSTRYGTFSFDRVLNNHYYLQYWNTSATYRSILYLMDISNQSPLGYAYDTMYFKDDSPCTHISVIMNETNCEYFSCTWKKANTQKFTLAQSKDTFYSIIFDVFTFQYDFGLGGGTISLFLTLIFIYIPLLILLVAIIYALLG